MANVRFIRFGADLEFLLDLAKEAVFRFGPPRIPIELTDSQTKILKFLVTRAVSDLPEWISGADIKRGAGVGDIAHEIPWINEALKSEVKSRFIEGRQNRGYRLRPGTKISGFERLDPSFRLFIGNLQPANPLLVGRKPELDYLSDAWNTPATNFVQLFATAGAGKTALVYNWFQRHLNETDIFCWSFNGQGVRTDRPSSSDFFEQLLPFLHIKVSDYPSDLAWANAAATHLRQHRLLLLLDGVEGLQADDGALYDSPLKTLLHELALANRGLVVCTTWMPIDIPSDPPRSLSLEVLNLQPEEGAQYLRDLRIDGPDKELQDASKELGNHPLALTLLGTFLADFHDRNIYRRREIRQLSGETGELYDGARRMVRAYEQMFDRKPEAAILRALGYFNRPAEPTALRLVLPELDDRSYQATLNHLYRVRLILGTDPAQPVDCNALVREHFAAKADQEGHEKLYHHYAEQAPYQPETREQMIPLFHAVYHGSRCRLRATSVRDIYYIRILRGEEAYLTKRLGDIGTDLSLLSGFFKIHWTETFDDLSPKDQSWLISKAGYSLRAVGRLVDAVKPILIAAEAAEHAGDLVSGAKRYGNLSELYITLGNITDAIVVAKRAVRLAKDCGEWVDEVLRCAELADAFHQAGMVDAALTLFQEAEQLQSDRAPEYPILRGIPGYQYCDLLLEQGRSAEVLQRASQTLRWAEDEGILFNIGLSQVSLGSAYSRGSPDALHHLDRAVEVLDRGGHIQFLPIALLARGTSQDLDQAFRIADRSGMRLFLADYYLASARLALTNGDRKQALGQLAHADALIRKTSYFRHAPEVERLRSELAN